MNRIHVLILFSAISICFSSCSHILDKDYPFTFTGTIEETGATTYMYGTHVIFDQDNYYAIKSENIDLDHYINNKVTIGGEIISGYPVDGGPVYINVLEVK